MRFCVKFQLDFISYLEIYIPANLASHGIFDLSSLLLKMHDLYMKLRRGFVRPKFHQTL